MAMRFVEQPKLRRSAKGPRRAALDAVQEALAAIPLANLQALQSITREPASVAPALMYWIEHATAWETDRRARRAYALHPPLDAIDPGQIFPSMLALAALSRRFGTAHPQIDAFFRAVTASLNAGQTMH